MPDDTRKTCGGTGVLVCEQCARVLACTVCDGNGYLPSPERCGRCGFRGCQTVTCPECGGLCDDCVAHDSADPPGDYCPGCPDCESVEPSVSNCDTSDTSETKAELCADVVVLRARIAELEAEIRCLAERNAALGRWQCAECGGRFEELPDVPNVVMDGIKRCSPCVERQIYREKLDAAKVLVTELEAEIEDLQHLASASLDTRPHAEPADCPSWHDGCNCTVEALECAIERGDRAEAKLQIHNERLRREHDTEIGRWRERRHE